jgi:hypothetical protein
LLAFYTCNKEFRIFNFKFKFIRNFIFLTLVVASFKQPGGHIAMIYSKLGRDPANRGPKFSLFFTISEQVRRIILFFSLAVSPPPE